MGLFQKIFGMKNDAAWGEFNRLLTVYFGSDVSLSDIYEKMRLFLQREGRNVLAVRFGVWAHLYKTKAYYTELTGHPEKRIEELKSSGLDMDDELKKRILETEQYSIDNAEKWIRTLESEEDVDDLCGKLLKKAKQVDQVAKLREIVMHHLERLPDLSPEKVAKEVDALFA